MNGPPIEELRRLERERLNGHLDSHGLMTSMSSTVAPTGGPKIRSFEQIPSIFDFAAQKIDYVWHGQLAAGTVNAFTGESGSGKSTVISGLGYAISEGNPFAGIATQRRPVLILDRENPLAVVVERFERLGIRDSQNFRIWGGWCPEEPPDAFSNLVAGWVLATTPKPVIFVDSLVAFHQGNENDAGETRAHMDGYRRLADMGATIVVLHHNGKAESTRDYRGSSDFKASLDVGYVVTNIGNPARIESLRLRAFKQRLAVNPELVLRFHEQEFHCDVSSSGAQTNIEILRQLLIENSRITGGEFEKLAATKSIPQHRTRDFLRSGILDGSIDVESGPSNAKLHTWLGPRKGENF